MKKTFLLFGFFFSIVGMAQPNAALELSFEEYVQAVFQYHPVARQANLQGLYGEASILKAKGGFDPKIAANLSQKYFDDKKYYSLGGGEVKIPTWYGISFSAGYELNDGVFLSDQYQTPNSGLVFGGVSVSLGQGMLMNKRRAELKKAEVFNAGTRFQQAQMMNDLLLRSGMAYWEWFRSYQELQIYENALTTASRRFDAIQQMAVLGDRPFIDTVEASIQVQNRTLQFQQAQLNNANSTAKLSVYLWAEGGIPLDIPVSMVPEKVNLQLAMLMDTTLYAGLDTCIEQHPSLQLYGNKLEQLEIQQKWNREQLKPTLDLKYNPITQAMGADVPANYSINNYTWGLQFSMPILLRKERGDLKQTGLQMQEIKLGQENKEAAMRYKALAMLNEWKTTTLQMQTYQRTVNDSERLLDGERQLFDGGESSLFMINSRELLFINTQRKWVELQVKNRIAELKTKYALGILFTME